ncbi:MAG: DNA-binding protein [Pseudomonadota bacterium]
MTTEEVLINKFGPLLTLSQVASLLDRSPEGLRLTIRGDNELGKKLKIARIKIGRRVHFKVQLVARLLDGCSSDA